MAHFIHTEENIYIYVIFRFQLWPGTLSMRHSSVQEDLMALLCSGTQGNIITSLVKV